MATLFKQKLPFGKKEDKPGATPTPEEKKKKEEEEKAKKDAEKKKKEDDSAAKKKKEEDDKLKKDAEKARKDAEKAAAAPPSGDTPKKNWFSSVVGKGRSGSISADAPPAVAGSSPGSTPTRPSAIPTSSPSPAAPAAVVQRTRVGTNSGRSSTGGSDGEGDRNAATRAEKEAAFAADGVKFTQDPGATDIRVKAGSLQALVKRLTAYQFADPSYLVDFMLTYRSFTTPKVFLDLLIERFTIDPPQDLGSQIKLDEWKRQVQTPIRLRVFNVIKTWISNYYHDFENDENLLAMLSGFVNTTMATSGMKTSADTLTNILARKRVKEDKEIKKQFSVKPPQPILPINMKATASLLDYDPQELARQMTLIDHELLAAVKPYEFLDVGWSREDKETRCPNLMQSIRRFNTGTFWVATVILQAPNKDTRVAMLKHFILTAKWLRKLNNFNGAMQIVAGLGQSSVFRLKDAWEEVPKKLIKKHEKTKELLSRDKGYQTYRSLLKTVNPPCVPYLGLCMSDLLFLEEASSNTDIEGLINFDKRFAVAKVIREIQGFQNTPYCLEQVFFIRDFLLNITCLDENELYQISLRILPKAERGSVRVDLNPPKDFPASARSANVPTLTPPAVRSRSGSSESLSSARDSDRSPAHTARPALNEEALALKEKLAQVLADESTRARLREMFREELAQESLKLQHCAPEITEHTRAALRTQCDDWQKNSLEPQLAEVHTAIDGVLNLMRG